MENPIGLFDSGVGGLTVLTSVQKALPHENIIYIGDNAHCPYGDKSKAQLLSYTRIICDYFASRHVKMIVLACNTTSANCLNELQEYYPDIPIIGVIHSTVNDYISTGAKRVLIMATHATVHSHQYKRMIESFNMDMTVYELETPRLVPLIESGQYLQGIEDVIEEYLNDYQDKVDALILGCTHYPILIDQIKNVFGHGKIYVSSSHAICLEVKNYLDTHHMIHEGQRQFIEIYTTGDVDEFYHSSKDFFDYQDLKVKHLSL